MSRPRPPTILSSSSTPKPTSPTGGVKRKRASEPKFYAVRVGYKPGVYHDWPSCLEQVKGYKNALFKSFPTLTEAELFVQHGLVRPGASSGAQTKFYAVRSGRVPGVYMDWPSAQQQVVGWTKPQHKAFHTRAEADAWLRGEQPAHSPTSKKLKKASAPTPTENDLPGLAIPAEPGIGPLPPEAEDGFDARIILDPSSGRVVYKTEAQRGATKMRATGAANDAVLHIYTDGSALGNGGATAIAGVGVFFGPRDPRNISESLPGPRQTNQRAELTAIQRALDLAPRDRHVRVFSDSKYAISCVTTWFSGWRANGWLTAAKKPVENRDLIEAVVARIDERHRAGRARTEFEWVRGHADDPGNVAADGLAVEGARAALGRAGREG